MLPRAYQLLESAADRAFGAQRSGRSGGRAALRAAFGFGQRFALLWGAFGAPERGVGGIGQPLSPPTGSEITSTDGSTDAYEHLDTKGQKVLKVSCLGQLSSMVLAGLQKWIFKGSQTLGVHMRDAQVKVP